MEHHEHNQGQPPRPWIVRVGSRMRHRIDRISTASSKIPVEPILSQEEFPWTKAIADNWKDIAAEAEAVIKHRDAIPPLRELSPDHQNTGRDGKWRSFFLIGYGYKVEENCLRAPKTAELVEKIPDLNSAFFSILDPGATIPPHRGVTRGLITCHLGVKIPKDAPNYWIEVEGQKTHWHDGKWLVFDDCFVHQVANETDEMRVVLLVQVKRPMRFFGRLVHDAWLWAIRKSPFVQDARKNFDKWEEAFATAEANEPA